MDPEPTYTIYIRLPFPRGNFVDPPPINWDSSKDEVLWNILSGVSKGEIDWHAIAAEFNVTVDFLIQHSTYLTDRHASQVRAQMRKAAASKGSAAPSPIPGSDSAAAMAAEMRRAASAGGASAHVRAPSSLSIRKDAPYSKNDALGIATKPSTGSFTSRPQLNRTSSGNMTPGLQQRTGASTPRQQVDVMAQQHRRRLSSLPMPTTPTTPGMRTRVADDDDVYQSPGPADSSSASSSASSSPAQSRIIRRPPRFSNPSGGAADGQMSPEDEEAEAAFLPSDLGSTLRGDPSSAARRAGRGPIAKDRIGSIAQSETSDSSSGSAAIINRSPARGEQGHHRISGPFSPRRTAELSGRAGSGGKGKGYSRDGSDGGTPSMGSSFSDLDDASVTQSALEEALASNMQDGTIGSRMSNFGQAFRSRYLPTKPFRQSENK